MAKPRIKTCFFMGSFFLAYGAPVFFVPLLGLLFLSLSIEQDSPINHYEFYTKAIKCLLLCSIYMLVLVIYASIKLYFI